MAQVPRERDTRAGETIPIVQAFGRYTTTPMRKQPKPRRDTIMTETTENNLGDYNLASLARMIYADWSKRGKGVNFAAVPYLKAMGTLDTLESNYGYDSARSIVVYFLSNAGSWRGNVARAVKAELKRRLK